MLQQAFGNGDSVFEVIVIARQVSEFLSIEVDFPWLLRFLLTQGEEPDRVGRFEVKDDPKPVGVCFRGEAGPLAGFRIAKMMELSIENFLRACESR